MMQLVLALSKYQHIVLDSDHKWGSYFGIGGSSADSIRLRDNCYGMFLNHPTLSQDAYEGISSQYCHYHQFIDSGTANYILSSGGSFVGSTANVNRDGIYLSGLNRGSGDHNYGSRTFTIIHVHIRKLVPLQV